MNDQTFFIVFRLLHIGCGIFWAGSVIYFALFIIPAVNRSGVEGTRFLQQLSRTGYPVWIVIMALTSIVSGILLMWKLSNGFERIWFTALYTKIISIGMVTSIVAFLIGFTVNRPAASRIDKISSAIAATGSTPTNEQMQELLKLRNRIFGATKIIAILLAITVISMSIFRWVS